MWGTPLRAIYAGGPPADKESGNRRKGRRIDEKNEKKRMPVFTVVCAYAALCLRGCTANGGSGCIQIYRVETRRTILGFLRERRKKDRVGGLEGKTLFPVQKDNLHAHEIAQNIQELLL